MFWNLVRYEFKNVNKWYLALYGAVLFLSVPIGMQAHYYNYESFTNSQPVLFIFLAFVFGGLIITLGISTLILIIRRFKGSVYDRQGYLTLTLPVSEHQIIWGKETIQEGVLDYEFSLSPRAFYQLNPEQTEIDFNPPGWFE